MQFLRVVERMKGRSIEIRLAGHTDKISGKLVDVDREVLWIDYNGQITYVPMSSVTTLTETQQTKKKSV